MHFVMVFAEVESLRARLAERDQLLAGLEAVADEWARGAFVTQPGDEDIHTAVERRLGELIGPTAGKLHTGRSRNDQVATDVRLWLRTQIDQLDAALRDVQDAAVTLADAHLDALLALRLSEETRRRDRSRRRDPS